MPVPARSFRFELGSEEAIGPNRARPRWLTERIAAMGESPTKIRFTKRKRRLELADKESSKAAVRSDFKKSSGNVFSA